MSDNLSFLGSSGSGTTIWVSSANPLPVVVGGGSSSTVQAVGDSAAGVADSGSNPVKTGAVVDTAISGNSFTPGWREPLRVNAAGALAVSLYSGSGTPGSNLGITGSLTDGQSNTFSWVSTASRGLVYNGTTWDKICSGVAAAANGNAGTGVQAVEEGGRPYSHISTATTTTVKSGKGALHAITVNTLVASATITLYDSTTGSGTVIGVIALPGTITSDMPITLGYDIAYTTGLTIVTSGATDLTVSYR